MEKIWLKAYPPGVPAEINPDAYQSIVDVFLSSCANYPTAPAFYNLGVTLTYQQMEVLTRAFAAYLQQTLQLAKGSRVAIMLPNTLQYPIAMFGALRAGMVVVNVNPLYKSAELIHQLNDAGAIAIVGITNFAATIQQAREQVPTLKHIILTELGDLQPRLKAVVMNWVLKYIHKKIPHWEIPNYLSFRKILQEGKKLSLTPVTIHNHEIAFLQYTGGTTGISKGAMLTHRNLIANIQQASAWFKGLLGNNEVIITALPLYHIFSLLANCLYLTRMGGLNVLITNPRDISSMIKEMKKFKFTVITGVNTLFNALIKHPLFVTLDFSHLHLALGGGMAVQRVVAEKWQQVTRVPLLEAYGLTETSPCVTINPWNLHEYNGSIGLPVSSTDIAILDEHDQELPLGKAGELAVKGPQVMQGYWNNASETAKVFTKEGWLLTGDIASIDERGFVYLLERKKDMILVSGFNVYPNEIEDVIARYPGVREVAVVGVHDDNSGEAPKAYIVKEDPNITAEMIMQYCHDNLTGYKVPKQIEFSTELPKTNVGKILRRALRDSTAVQ